MDNNILRAFRNTSYGPPLVSTKYSPLGNFDFSLTRREFCAGLLKQRWNLLHSAGLLPQPLALVMPSWQEAINAEARNRRPPLVVISTNRSAWIKKAFKSVSGIEFENESDVSALIPYAGQTVSPPIYTPSRIADGEPRSVYIVVNSSEYIIYKSALAEFAEKGVTVVGWEFRAPHDSPIRLCGFGASRFAAIEFCKTLRNWSKSWNYAWLLDDTVVALTGFPGYKAVETAMDKSKPKWACAGFKGGTKAEPQSEAQSYARAELAAGRGHQKDYELKEPASADKAAIIQQAALWNIEYLSDNLMNFGPMFLESGEDVSFTRYFDFYEVPYAYYTSIGVHKEDSSADSTVGGNAIKTARAKLVAWMAAAEARDPATTPAEKDQPPPIKILPNIPTPKPPKPGELPPPPEDPALQTLANYIVNAVLPRAQEPVPADAHHADEKEREKYVNKQNTAKCQAIELTILKAMEAGRLVDHDALRHTFQINDEEFQEVLVIDRR